MENSTDKRNKSKPVRSVFKFALKHGFPPPTKALGDRLRGNEARIIGDHNKSLGLFAYQKWNKIGLDFYAGYRLYDVKRPGIDLYALNIFVLGVIFGF